MVADKPEERRGPAPGGWVGVVSGGRLDRLPAVGYGPPLRGPWRVRAQVAQLVEHATENRSVGGSIPPLGTIRLFSTVSFYRPRYAISLPIP